jgi:transposase
LLKNPENLTLNQQAQLEYYVKANPELYKAYLLKERLRLIFKQDSYRLGVLAFGRFLLTGRQSNIPAFVALCEKLTRNKKYILATLKYGLSAGKLEAKNNIIKSIIRRSFGFRNVDNLIAMIYLRTSANLYSLGEHFFNFIG